MRDIVCLVPVYWNPEDQVNTLLLGALKVYFGIQEIHHKALQYVNFTIKKERHFK